MAATPKLPVTAIGNLENTFADEVAGLTVPWQGAHAPDPTLLVLNESLAAELQLDIDELRADDGVGVLSGSTPPVARPSVIATTSARRNGSRTFSRNTTSRALTNPCASGDLPPVFIRRNSVAATSTLEVGGSTRSASRPRTVTTATLSRRW